ncbi:MAG TPA: sigma-70 family RNA polymerase sigma factor [Sideroxyarcus sp.]|nr:sigma-70 family RNA polymerase sigma factor [Sideroxyarcus sp.]
MTVPARTATQVFSRSLSVAGLTPASSLECSPLILVRDSEIALARKVAASTARRWRLVDRDDLTSALLLWLFEHAEQVERYRNEAAEPKLYVALRREAAKWCAKETREVTGQPLDYHDEYTSEQVVRAMPYVFEDTPVTTARDADNVDDHSSALAIMTDFKNAYRDQPADVKEILALRFRDGLTEQQIAELTGASQPTVHRRVKRAVERVRRTLCGTP